MSDLWWLKPEWKEATCSQCGSQIWPDGDPDWGVCWPCKRREQEYAEDMRHFYEQEAQAEHYRMLSENRQFASEDSHMKTEN